MNSLVRRIWARLRAAYAGLSGARDRTLIRLRNDLAVSHRALSVAVAAAGITQLIPATHRGVFPMAASILQQLADQVKANTDLEASAVQALNGVAARIDAAVTAALANGATAAELAPITDEVASLKASAAALSAAIAANTTPAAP